MRSNLDEMMFALNEHITKAGAPLLDATFLGTLQRRSHRALLESCIDVNHPSPALVRALTALGNAHVSTYRKPTVSVAIKLLSNLREAAQHMAAREDRGCNCSEALITSISMSPKQICDKAEENLRDAIQSWALERVKKEEDNE